MVNTGQKINLTSTEIYAILSQKSRENEVTNRTEMHEAYVRIDLVRAFDLLNQGVPVYVKDNFTGAMRRLYLDDMLISHGISSVRDFRKMTYFVRSI